MHYGKISMSVSVTWAASWHHVTSRARKSRWNFSAIHIFLNQTSHLINALWTRKSNKIHRKHSEVDGHQMWIDLKHGGFFLFGEKKRFPIRWWKRMSFRENWMLFTPENDFKHIQHSPFNNTVHFGLNFSEFISEINIKYKSNFTMRERK